MERLTLLLLFGAALGGALGGLLLRHGEGGLGSGGGDQGQRKLVDGSRSSIGGSGSRKDG